MIVSLGVPSKITWFINLIDIGTGLRLAVKKTVLFMLGDVGFNEGLVMVGK